MIEFDSKESSAEFCGQVTYTVPKSGFFSVKGEVIFKDRHDTIQWTGEASDESDALEKALKEFGYE